MAHATDLLTSANPEDRLRGIVEIVRHPSKEGYARVLALADLDERLEIRVYARRALDALRKAAGLASAPAGSEDVDLEMAQEYLGGSEEARLRFIRFVNERNVRDSLPRLVRHLKTDTSAAVICAALKTIGHVGGEPSLKLLVRFLDHANARIRADAIEAVLLTGSLKGVPYLCRRLEDNDTRVRTNAIIGLCNVRRADSLRVLRAMLLSQQPAMQASAAYAMQWFPDGENAGLLGSLLTHPQEVVRNNTWRSLKAMSDKGVARARTILSSAVEPLASGHGSSLEEQGGVEAPAGAAPGPNIPCPRCQSPMMAADERWVCVSCGEVVELPAVATVPLVAFVNLEELPVVIAVPLKDYVAAGDPQTKLMALCDVVEYLLRFLVIVRIADIRRGGCLPADLLKELSHRIAEPTLGKWQGMAEALANWVTPEAPVFPEIIAYVNSDVHEFLEKFGEIRKQVFHGGGMSREMATRILELWQERFETLVGRASWLGSGRLVVRNADGSPGLLRGPIAEPQPRQTLDADTEAQLRENLPGVDRIAFLRDRAALELWPLGLHGVPASPDADYMATRPVPQVYTRKGAVRLEYSAVGSLEVSHSVSGEDARQAFLDLFGLRAEPQDKTEEVGFETEFRKDSDLLVGREEELNRVCEALAGAITGCHGSDAGRVLWLSGRGGMGKSFLVAWVVVRLLEELRENELLLSPISTALKRILSCSKETRDKTRILPFRFKAGNDYSNRHTFLKFAVERLERFLPSSPEPSGEKEGGTKWEKTKDPCDRLKALLKRLDGRTVVFVLDGLDEIARRDPMFPAEIPLTIRTPGVVWLCAGRPEDGLDELFSESVCERLFPNGLPKMTNADIRGLLLEQLGSHKYELLRFDQEVQAGEVGNEFVERTERASEGLPLYVTYLVHDIVAGRIRLAEAGVKIPESLDAYNLDLVQRLKQVGTRHQVRTPIMANLAIAMEPLSLEELGEILVQGKSLPASKDAVELVREELTSLGSMVKMMAKPGGQEGFAIYHQTLKDCILTSADMEVPIGTAQKLICDLVMQEEMWKSQAGMYLLRWGVRLLIKEGRWADVGTALQDCAFFEAKGLKEGVYALVEDFHAALCEDVLLSKRERAKVEALAHALLRTAHLVRDAPELLVPELRDGVFLQTADDTGVRQLSEDLTAWCSQPGRRAWLRRVARPPRAERSPLLMVLTGHANRVHAVGFAPDGSRIVSGGGDDAVKVWDAATGREIMTLTRHTSSVHAVAFSPDGSRIVSGSADRTVKVWDAEDGRELLTLKGHSSAVNSVAFSPDGSRIVSGSDDNTVGVWDSRTGSAVMRLREGTGRVDAVTFTPDGERIVSKGPRVRVWDAASGGEVATLGAFCHDDARSVACSPDGERIVSGAHGGKIKVWDIATGQEIATLPGHEGGVLGGVAFSPDGTRIVSVGGDKAVRVRDAASGREIATLPGHKGSVRAVACSRDGTRIVSGSFDSTVIVWDATLVIEGSARQVAAPSGHDGSVLAAAFSPDGSRIVSGSFDTRLKVWDATNGREIGTLSGHRHRVYCVAYSPDGTQIVSGSLDHAVKVWDAARGRELASLEGHSTVVYAVVFSPDGSRIASASADGTVKVWEVTTGRAIHTLVGHKGWLTAVVFSPDGARIVSAGRDNTESWIRDNAVRVWDVATGREVHTLEGHKAGVYSVAFSPDGARIVSGSEDGTVKVWDASTGRAFHTFVEHTGVVSCVSFSPDGRQVISGSDNGQVVIRDAFESTHLSRLEFSAAIKCVRISSDGRQVWVADDGGHTNHPNGHVFDIVVPPSARPASYK